MFWVWRVVCLKFQRFTMKTHHRKIHACWSYEFEDCGYHTDTLNLNLHITKTCITIPYWVLNCFFFHYEPYYNNVLIVMSALFKFSKAYDQQYTTNTKHNDKLKIMSVWYENVNPKLCTMKSHHRKKNVRGSYECGDRNWPAETLYDVNLHHTTFMPISYCVLDHLLCQNEPYYYSSPVYGVIISTLT